MDIQEIKEIALANGFSLKEQASGNMDLHSYVYEFANAIEQAAKAQAAEASTSIAVHQRIIDEVKTEINEGYDLCQDSYLLDVLVERGMEIGKIQTIPEGFVLVPMVPSERMVDAVRKCYEGEAYLPYSLYSEFINQAMIEAKEQSND